EVWCSSADWMERNFFRRFEVCFPILDEALRSRVMAESLELPLLDNQQAWTLRPDGTYEPALAGKKQPLRCQQALLDHHAEPLSAQGKRASRSAEKTRRARRAGGGDEARGEPRSRRA